MANEIAAAYIGLGVGSFVNVLVSRLPALLSSERCGVRGVLKGLSFPGSSCPRCARRLVWWENIPVFSYLLLKGACRSCGYAIPFRYVGVEILVCLQYVALAFLGHWGVLQAFLLATLTALAFLDFESRLLPDLLTLPLLALGICEAVLSESRSVVIACSAAAIAYVYFLVVSFVSSKFSGRMALGGGDAKLVAALGAWFGIYGVGIIVFLAGIISLVIAATRRRWGIGSAFEEFPFGASLCVVAGFVFFLSESPYRFGSFWAAVTGIGY